METTLREPASRRAIPLPTARGLNRVEAARYVGMSPAFFDGLVKSGVMPAPKRVGTRTIFDVRALDAAFDAMGEDAQAAPNEWDAVLDS